jgi:hypothetical protein
MMFIVQAGNTKGGSITVPFDLLFDWFEISCMTIDIFCFYLQNRLIQTSQTGGQQYSDTPPFSISWYRHHYWRLPIDDCNVILAYTYIFKAY